MVMGSGSKTDSTTIWMNANTGGCTPSGYKSWLHEAIHLVKQQLEEAETPILDEGQFKIEAAKTQPFSGSEDATMYWCETPYKRYLVKGEALHYKHVGRKTKRKFSIGGICIDKEVWEKFYGVWGREPTLLHYDSMAPPAILFRYNFGWVADNLQYYTQDDGQEVIVIERIRWYWNAKDDIVLGL